MRSKMMYAHLMNGDSLTTGESFIYETRTASVASAQRRREAIQDDRRRHDSFE